ncbi:MAG: hypothetical protein ACOH2K_14035 [Burkholderiaceae bacterium]
MDIHVGIDSQMHLALGRLRHFLGVLFFVPLAGAFKTQAGAVDEDRHIFVFDQSLGEPLAALRDLDVQLGNRSLK